MALTVPPLNNNDSMQQDAPARKPRVFFPNLDGWRFLCFLAVFLFHSFATTNPVILQSRSYHFIKIFLLGNGDLGVNFFFVLSGFLITYLLLVEKQDFGKVNIGNFYLRRIFRIWPLYFLCVIFGFFIFPILKSHFGEVPNETARLPYYLGFLSNIDWLKTGTPDASNLTVLWSVSIEEQFYLVWPLIVAATPVKWLKWVFAALIAGSFAYRLYNAGNLQYINYHTFACISDLTVGGCFALAAFNKTKVLRFIQQAPKAVWALLYVLVIAVFLYQKNIFGGSPFLLAIDRLVVSVLFGLVIMEQNYAEHSLFKMGNNRLLSKLGNYTYGLYCLQMIGILIAAKGLAKLGLNNSFFGLFGTELIVSLGVTIAIAMASYHIFEKPFLKLKARFSKVATHPVS